MDTRIISSFRVWLFVTSICASSQQAHGLLIGSFEGQVSRIDALQPDHVFNTLRVGDTVTGNFRYDAAKLTQDPGDPALYYLPYNAGRLQVSIGSCSWINANDGNVVARNDSGFAGNKQDSFSMAIFGDEASFPGYLGSYSSGYIIANESGDSPSLLRNANVPATTSDLHVTDATFVFGGLTARGRGIRNDLSFSVPVGGISFYDPPALIELAQMSECAHGSSCLIEGYTEIPLGEVPGAPSTFAVKAFVDAEGERVVLAVRGTDDLTDWVTVNPTFISANGGPTQNFLAYLGSAEYALTVVAARYPDAEITLTGHSLGGALAQVLGNNGGFSAITFNAPGAAQVQPYLGTDLEDRLSQIDNPRSYQDVTNYRVYGDLVSTIGVQFGETVPYEPPIPRWQVDQFPVGTAKPMHEMLIMKERVINEAATTADIGPVATDAAAASLFGLPGCAYGSVVFCTTAITGVVVAGQQIWVDPEGFDLYSFSVDPESPAVQAVIFPLILDIDAVFDLEAFAGDVWSSLGTFQELSVYDFGPNGIDQFRFFVRDRLAQRPPASIGALSFGVRIESETSNTCY